MPHITFIHGIANKPSKDDLLNSWEHYLASGGFDLGAKGVSTSMVYWADVMYAAPLASGADFESADGVDGVSDGDENLDWVVNLPPSEKIFVKAMTDLLGFELASPEGDDFVAGSSGPIGVECSSFEAIPLPWFIKRRLMKRLLKDVHHYLFNASYSPRLGEVYQVQDYVRTLFINQLKEDAENASGPHIVVSHSMGTVIAYDCLKNVPQCPSIDGLMTVGSPLGISEVYDNFKPAYMKKDAFPSDKVRGEWVNVYDRLDPVALDAKLSNDYQYRGAEVVRDHRVKNCGSWRHSSWKYFGQEDLCAHLKRLLKV